MKLSRHKQSCRKAIPPIDEQEKEHEALPPVQMEADQTDPRVPLLTRTGLRKPPKEAGPGSGTGDTKVGVKMQGSDLKMLREHRGLSRAEVGAALNLTEQFIGMMERDAKVIDPRTQIAAVAKLAPLYVVTFSKALKKWTVDRRYVNLTAPGRIHTIVGTYASKDEALNDAKIMAAGVFGAEVLLV